jgi:hypothetical protein
MTRLDRALERLVGPGPVHKSVADAMIVAMVGGYVAGVLAAHYLATVQPNSPVEFLPLVLVPILIVSFGVLARRRVAHPRVMLDDWLEECTDWIDDKDP